MLGPLGPLESGKHLVLSGGPLPFGHPETSDEVYQNVQRIDINMSSLCSLVERRFEGSEGGGGKFI